ncbi:aminopeptidase [Advenella kashmirensis WT001]|uniref:Aminopeptidase n=1 Tax=Advenella kashmirensis (strain DSM 17095 / LMG 22695 / WT001) TaxID=1036672 RepID=I3UBB5_ADVKW|nr:aminopeptidase [Advenella kashmirensis WT001]
MLSLKAAQELRQSLTRSDSILKTDSDLLAVIWPDRPGLPAAPVFEHSAPFATRSRQRNVQAVRQAMTQAGAQWHLISALDDIAWVLNLRGSDVSYNPVFLSHLLIGPDSAVLFVDKTKLVPELIARLAADGVTVEGYDDIQGALTALPHEALLVDPARTTVGLLAHARSVSLIEKLNPSQRFKSVKNQAEIANVRQAMEQDGAAVCEFFAWFETAMENGELVTELTIDEQITAARARQPHFVSPSFSTIAGFNANGAMPHYMATPESFSVIEGDGLLLIDSGGQYLNGTTDITRVVPVGQIGAEHRRDFTLVLKGMIGLAAAVFPEDYPAPLLDTLARAPLWAQLLDFGHGTGHGVGYFMNVHEGPQMISHRAYRFPDTEMKAGMITSDEPGLYRPGQWGIRIENLICAVPAGQSEFGNYLKFETLTLCPIDTRCIERQLLSEQELSWLNAYHEEVYRRLAPRVSGHALTWLQTRTAAI